MIESKFSKRMSALGDDPQGELEELGLWDAGLWDIPSPEEEGGFDDEVNLKYESWYGGWYITGADTSLNEWRDKIENAIIRLLDEIER